MSSSSDLIRATLARRGRHPLEIQAVLAAIASSFSSTDDIQRQFDLDYHRMSIHINNVLRTRERFLEMIAPLRRHRHHLPEMKVAPDLFSLTLMLCNQAAFCDAYIFMAGRETQGDNHLVPSHPDEGTRQTIAITISSSERLETGSLHRDGTGSISHRESILSEAQPQRGSITVQLIKTFHTRSALSEKIIRSHDTITTYRFELEYEGSKTYLTLSAWLDWTSYDPN